MARPSYLARRGDGRYFLQIRLGKQAAQLFGLPLLRVGLRTGNFDEARRRLMDNLGWVQELIAAPDLEALGTVLDARLRAYVDRGVPADQRFLAERHPNAAAAVTKAEAFSRKPGHVGALAFSRSGATGDFEHAKLIRKFGEVPDDLSAL